jgi:hypothetical protein
MNFNKKYEKVETKINESEKKNQNIMTENERIENQLLILTEGKKMNLTESIEFLKTQNLKLHKLEEDLEKKEINFKELSEQNVNLQERIMKLLNQYGVKIEKREEILSMIQASLSQKVTNFNTLLCIRELTKNPNFSREFSINPEVPCDFPTVEQLISLLNDYLNVKENIQKLTLLNTNLTEDKANLLKTFQDKMNDMKKNSTSHIGDLQTNLKRLETENDEKTK